MTNKEQQNNLIEILMAQVDGQSTAIYSEQRAFSYADLKQAVSKMACLYHCRGLRPTDRVMIMLPDSVAWVVAYLGAIWAGLVPMGVSPYLAAADFEIMYRLAIPRLIMADAVCQQWLGIAAIDDITTRIHFIADDNALLRQLAELQEMRAYSHHHDADLFWVFTSGSSGRPKGIVHGATAVIHSIQFARDVLAINARDRLYATSRLFFAYPLAKVLFAAIGCGASMILHRSWPTCKKMISMIKYYQPTVVFSIPTLYRQLLAQAGLSLLLPGVRQCVSAGEHLSDHLAQAWCAATSVPLMNGYGMSETLSFVLYGNVGKVSGVCAAPGVRIYSSHQERSRLSFTHPGLYKRQITSTEEKYCPEIYSSDDVFVEVSPQRLKFQSRADCLVKVNGRFIHSGEEEDLLLTYCATELQDAAVICEPDNEGNNQLVWCLVRHDAVPLLTVEEKLQRLKQSLPAYRRPALWRYYQILPRTLTGKILYRQLIEKRKQPEK